MTTTLIVRDAVLAACGAPVERRDLGQHLRARVALVQAFDPEQVEDSLDVLAPSCGGDQSDPKVLEAALILALAHGEAAAARGLEVPALGRTLAAVLEAAGDRAGAHDALEIVLEACPRDVASERELKALARRERRDRDVVERHLRRARSLAGWGRTEDAVRELRAVLAIDPTRTEAARAIRDLRFEAVDSGRRRRRTLRLALVAAAAASAVALVVVREARVAAMYEALPPYAANDLPSVQTRLAAVEDFVLAHPLWHGAVDVLRDRTALRIEVTRLEEEERRRREVEAAETAQREAVTERLLANAHLLAETGDLEGALRELERALATSDADWPQRDRALRDAEAIRDHLARQGGEAR